MTEYIAITILVPHKDIEIDASVKHYPELPDEPESNDPTINCVEVTGLQYEVIDYDVIDIGNLAVERYKENKQ